ncbi:MAG: YegS/Rv2252/BmrU family lipid kinase [Candidatus Eremiobacteraeota bacterium]|nr:YegS/Rv2252/BmrU family lipid kinase [Candidatus Eremiobacteraeota bacterium]
MRTSLIVNSNSRLGRRHGPLVAEALERRGITLVRYAVTEAVDAIVVAGGDGTFARAIPLALRRGVPMGLVPLGTFNDLARTLRIPLELEAACEVIARAHRRRIDVAEVNGVYYVTEASIGLSSRLTRLQSSAGKQRFGWLAVALSGAAALRYLRPFRVEVNYDSARILLRTVQLTVANSNHFGRFITVGDAAIDDGWLDLYAVEPSGLRGAAVVAHAILRKQRFEAEGLRAYRSTRFQVATARPHRITADGEPAGTTPACFQILPQALQVLAPGP